MFCPLCGDELINEAGTLVCKNGMMELSPALATAFQECFVERTCPSPRRAVEFRIGGIWYCPGCGVQMREDGGLLECPRCHECLNRWIHPLVDIHPHVPTKDQLVRWYPDHTPEQREQKRKEYIERTWGWRDRRV